MSLQKTVSALRDCALFRGVDDGRLKLIALSAETLSFTAGEALFDQGDEGDSAFIVIDGEVDVLVAMPNGSKVMARIGRSEIFGEVAALTDQPRTARCIAVGDLIALRLDSASLKRLLREFPDLSLAMIGLIAARLSNTRLAKHS